jgi:large repetitive protein
MSASLAPAVSPKRLLSMVVLACVAASVLVSAAPAGNFDESRMGCAGENPGICPTGTEGQPYVLPIELLGDEDEQCAVYTISSGSLPPGLSVNSDGQRIEGTPTQAGTFDFYLSATYNRETTCPFKNPSDDPFRITINPSVPKLTIGPESAPVGTVSTQYSLQMIASVSDPKQWSINSGTLPTGLTIDPSTGLISGTPTAAGSYTFEVLAKVATDTRTDTKVLGIVIRDALAIVAAEPFSETRRAFSEVSAPFTATLGAIGGDGVYTWALASGVLPIGLSMSGGAIEGTPRVAGDYRFVVGLTDAEGRVASYAARITVAAKLVITTRTLPSGKVRRNYRAKLATTGGVKPTTWRLVSGPLPRGVRLDRTRGVLSGKPTRPGRYRITLEVVDEFDVFSTRSLTLVVKAAPKPKKPKK